MTRELPQLRSAWSFPLIEREREYRLTARLFRSRLVIEDERGNKIAVSKRSRDIKIKRWGKVEWTEVVFYLVISSSEH